MYAAQHGHTAVTKELLKVPECQLGSHTRDGTTALVLAARNGHFEVTKQLLLASKPDEIDAALSSRDDHDQTLLWTTALAGRTGIMQMFLAAMPRPVAMTIRNAFGQTPLHAAAIGGHAAVVQHLQASPLVASSTSRTMMASQR